MPFALRTSTWAGFTTLPDKRLLYRSTSYTPDHHEHFQTVSDLLCLHHLGHQLGNGFLSKRRQCDAQFLPNDHGHISISEILNTCDAFWCSIDLLVESCRPFMICLILHDFNVLGTPRNEDVKFDAAPGLHF